MSIEKVREEFEAWECDSDHGPQTDPVWLMYDAKTNTYPLDKIQARWMTWQESRAALVSDGDLSYALILTERQQLKTENIDLHATLQAAKGEIERLKAENEALRAEAAKWKNESVSDSQTIYSLSCNLAQRTGEVRELAGVVDDLAALTKKFVQRLSKAAPDNDLPAKAMDYLVRKGLQGSTMREIVEGRLS